MTDREGATDLHDRRPGTRPARRPPDHDSNRRTPPTSPASTPKVGRPLIIGALVVLAAGALTVFRFVAGAETEAESEPVELATASIEVRDLVDLHEVSGTLEFGDPLQVTAGSSGFLTSLASEGEVLERGDVLYIVSDEPSEIELASAEQRVASARSQLASANQQRSTLLEGSGESELASAEASVAQAQLALNELLEPASDADLALARAQLAKAEQTYSALFSGPNDTEVTAAQTDVIRAQQGVDSALANRDSAWISLLSAQSGYCGLSLVPVDGLCTEGELPLTATDVGVLTTAVQQLLAASDGPSVTLIHAFINASSSFDNAVAAYDSAVLSLESALVALDRLDDAPDRVDVEQALAAVRQAEANLEQLTSGPSELQVAQAQANLRAAEARLADLRAGASASERQQASASVENARLSLEVAALEQSGLVSGPQLAVIFYGTLPAWRAISAASSPGDDIEQLEENLVALGFDPEGAVVVDAVFDQATEQAVARWQESLGITADGEVDLGSIVFVPGPSQVGAAITGVAVGGSIASGAPLIDLTPISRVVTTTEGGVVEEQTVSTQRVVAHLDVDDRDLVDPGTVVGVELPDGSDVEGTVVSIGSVTTTTDQQGGDTSTVEVVIALSEPVDDTWTGAEVEVRITAELAQGVLAVPVSALLALVEGGYAVEMVDSGGTTRLVKVETGMFADGFVEITGQDLTGGMTVVVPR